MVELQQHQPRWADDFRREADRIATALDGAVDAIEHIGSTAVPGLVAKPIIDLAARTVASVDPFTLAPRLATIGYQQHSAGPKTHAVYVRTNSAGARTRILRVFRPAQWEDCSQRLFRDRLLHDAEARRRYGELKSSLAGSADGLDYTAGKTALVEELLNAERAARGLPPVSAWEK